jgi:hypothetical protein
VLVVFCNTIDVVKYVSIDGVKVELEMKTVSLTKLVVRVVTAGTVLVSNTTDAEGVIVECEKYAVSTSRVVVIVVGCCRVDVL